MKQSFDAKPVGPSPLRLGLWATVMVPIGSLMFEPLLAHDDMRLDRRVVAAKQHCVTDDDVRTVLEGCLGSFVRLKSGVVWQFHHSGDVLRAFSPSGIHKIDLVVFPSDPDWEAVAIEHAKRFVPIRKK